VKKVLRRKGEKAPFDIIKVGSANCTKESKLGIVPTGAGGHAGECRVYKV